MSVEASEVRASAVRALVVLALEHVVSDVGPSTATIDEVVAAIDREVGRTMTGIHEDVKAGCLSLMIELSSKARAGKGEGKG